MNDKQNEPKLTYALDELGKMVYVDDVDNGIECNCMCPECKGKLVAKNKGKIKEHHFAHSSGIDCPGARMTALHMLAQQIIEEDKQVMLPDYQGKYIHKSTGSISFDWIRLEEVIPIHDGQIRADCVGYKRDKNNIEHRLLIEILVTHEVDDNKRCHIHYLNESCIEIDLSDLIESGYTREDVAKRLKEDKKDRKWINCPVCDKRDHIVGLEEEKKKKELEANKREQKDKISKWFQDGDHDIANYLINDIKRYPFFNIPNSNFKVPNPLFEYLVPENNYIYYIENSPKNDDGLNLYYILLRFYYTETIYVNYNQLKYKLRKVQSNQSELTSQEKIHLEELISLRVMSILVKQRKHYHDIPSAVNEYNNLIMAYYSDSDIRNEVLMVSSVIYHHIVGSNAQNFGELTREIIHHHPSIARSYLTIIDSQSKYPNNYTIGSYNTLQELRDFVERNAKAEDGIVDKILKECFSYSYRSDIDNDIIEKIDIMSYYASRNQSCKKNMKDWDDWYDSLQ